VASEKSIPARHLCGSPYHKGPRWLLSCYFYRNKRQTGGLQAYCMTCTKIAGRPENQSQRVKDYRREYNRRYKEDQRRAKGIQPRNLIVPKFRGARLAAYLGRFIVAPESNHPGAPFFLNGITLGDIDRRKITRMKEGVRVELRTADYFATKYQLPLWEMIEEAGCYKKDKRSRKFTSGPRDSRSE
jgi:hypothetical protein